MHGTSYDDILAISSRTVYLYCTGTRYFVKEVVKQSGFPVRVQVQLYQVLAITYYFSLCDDDV
jgi:hypothetical protein